MSLQVWLPLNGDLHNQGLHKYPITIFRGTETYNNQGKIGKCFYSNGVNTIKILDIIPDFQTYISYSLCAWFYIETNNTAHSGSAIISAGDWNSQVLNLSLSDWSTDHYTRLRVSGTNWKNGYNYNFNKNTWYHVVVCSDGNKTYAYVNGNLIGNTIAGFLPSSISGHDLCIGGATYYGGMQFFGKINDVRIYNHCLSAKEVEEISKGLVLHYQLNEKYDGIDYNGSNYQNLNNCYNYPTFNTSNANGGWSHWGRTGASGTQGQNTNKDFIYNQQNTYSHWVKNANTATGEYLLYQSPAFNGGLRSLQAIVKEENSVPIDESVCFPAWNARDGGAPANLWTSIINLGKGFYLCKCEGISQDGSNNLVGIYVKPGYKVYFSEVYLENNQSTCTNILSYSSSTIYDCSGYKNNGQIVNQITPIESTPKYSTAISIIKNSYIKCTPFYFNTNQWTISHWYYKPTNPTTYECFYCLTKGDGADANKKFAAMPNTGRIWYKGESGYASISQLQIGAWTFLTLVCNGTTVIVYQNGEQIGSFAANTTMTDCHDLGIGVRANSVNFGTITCPSEFMISDFRVYATALTETQVKELYRTSMNVSGNNVLPRDLE